MKVHFILLLFLLMLVSNKDLAQATFPSNGAPNNSIVKYAFTNANIVVDAQSIISGTFLIEGETIVDIGSEVVIPSDAIVVDVDGKYIYPSFIDPFTSYGISSEGKDEPSNSEYESSKQGAYHWNENIQPELAASSAFKHDEKQAKKWVENGFGVVSSHISKGLMTGTAVVTTLNTEKENKGILKTKAIEHLSFEKKKTKQKYPSSLMGSIALIRQTYYDAEWYKGEQLDERNLSLEAINNQRELPKIFACKNKLDIMRADKIGDEFGIQYIFKGNGDEYQRIDQVKEVNAQLIIPVNFPKAYDTDDYFKNLDLSLSDMQHWKMAPYNPSTLEKNYIEFAFTMDGLDSEEIFMQNVRKSVKMGLTEESALSALTITPAEILGVEDRVGTLNLGKLANFIICSGKLFHEQTKILENWIEGVKTELIPIEEDILSGEFSLRIGDADFEMKVKKSKKKYKALIFAQGQKNDTLKAEISSAGKRVNMNFFKDDKLIQLSGLINESHSLWNGTGQEGANQIKWHAIKKKTSQAQTDSKEVSTAEINVSEGISAPLPLGGYGWDSLPKQETVLFRRATVWTNEEDGIMEDCDLLIQNGKILAIGPNLDLEEYLGRKPQYRTVIAKGWQITPGIIDEHSHIAIERGVNESGQASSAEVRIGDVINSEDVNIYRQLAGGVTCVQLLHGSANPIGGQSAIIKLRWGKSPEALKFEGAKPFIKFALGENVKQSNWGDKNTTRFPQTRMGVEQVYYDHFLRAKSYFKAKQNHLKGPQKSNRRKDKLPSRHVVKKNFRTDLELEALSEILNKERFITCHSYVQSEIAMLMTVADSMNFQVNTFTHILEGYKMAGKLRKHGANASTFSDWWAYKFEVNDAIPYNASLMAQKGLNVGINSDDAEMGRRLNQEAAKVVKYGGATEEEALKMVTLNPAKMLQIDQYVGSIKVGKDADIVVWDGHPLSIYTAVQQTYVDGINYYDKELDEKIRKRIASDRAQLIKEMAEEKKSSGKSQKIKMKEEHNYHCDDE